MSNLLILGGGPGGYTAAFEAAKQARLAGIDLTITIVEKEALGGTCLNVGCIPTKTILRTAHALADLNRLGEFALSGVDTSSAAVDLHALRSRKDAVISDLVHQIEATAQRLKINIVRGVGKVVESAPIIELAVIDDLGKESFLPADALIIATGSVPTVLPALDHDFVWTSDDALTLQEIPESIIIVGAGVIGAEFAQAYAAFGSKVSLVELSKTMMPWFDKRVGKTLQKELKAQGITLYMGSSVDQLRQDSKGQIVANLSTGKEIHAAVAMTAVGRTPNTANMGFEQAGIDFKGRALAVNDTYETNVNNIYAIGDAIGGLMLAHEAEHEGVIAARHAVAKIAGLPAPKLSALNASLVPGCIYTTPEIAVIGMSAESAKERNIPAIAGIAKYAGNGKALAEGDSDGYVQLVAHAQTGQVLGAQIVGAKAVELIAIIAPYMTHGASVTNIADTVFAHPTLSEVIKLAAEVCAAKLKV